VSIAGAQAASRVLILGSDADVSVALHLHLERAGFAIHCIGGTTDLEPLLRAIAPQVLVLMLPASPDASWGNALTTAAAASKVGVRVVVVAPSREVVEPLAAVAGAERSFSRAEVLSRPTVVVERIPANAHVLIPPAPTGMAPPPIPARPTGAPSFTGLPTAAMPTRMAPPTLAPHDSPPPARTRKPQGDLLAMIDEELVDEPISRPAAARIEVAVSLVSDHNFYVGPSKAIDSGGVFIATMMPPPVGTRLQLRLGLADGRKIDLDGEVTWIREKAAMMGRQPAGCGVKLFSLPGWAGDAVNRFLQARAPIVYAPR
jgi:hypothetical protein